MNSKSIEQQIGRKPTKDEIVLADTINRWKYGGPAVFAIEALGIKPAGASIGTDEFRLSNQQFEFFQHLNNLSLVKLMIKEKRVKEADTPQKQYYLNKNGIVTAACKGGGKDFELAIVILWALSCFDPIKIPCIAPSEMQLRTILWSEVRKLLSRPECIVKDWYEVLGDIIYARCPFTGKRIATRQCFAKTAMVSTDGTTNTMSGLHEEHMIIIIDEGSNVADGIFEQLDNTMTDAYNYAIVMFNPEKLKGFAREAHIGKMRKFWVSLRMDMEKSDRLDDYQKKIYLEKMEAKYGGRETNGYRIYVRGDYPTDECGGYIPWSWVMDAMERPFFEVSKDYPIVCGIDPGLLSDKTQMIYRRGPNIICKKEITPAMHQQKEELLCDLVVSDLEEMEAVACTIETNGIGHAIFTGCLSRAAGRGIRIFGITTTDKASTGEFYQKRDEIICKTKNVFKDGMIAMERDDEMLVEVTAFKLDVGEQFKGRVKLINNKAISKLIGNSPDSASALFMAIATDEKPFIRNNSKVLDYRRNKKDNRNINRDWMGG